MHTHTRTHARTHARTHTHTQPSSHTHTHTHTHTAQQSVEITNLQNKMEAVTQSVNVREFASSMF